MTRRVLQLKHYWLRRHLLTKHWLLNDVMMINNASFLHATVAGMRLRALLFGALPKGDTFTTAGKKEVQCGTLYFPSLSFPSPFFYFPPFPFSFFPPFLFVPFPVPASSPPDLASESVGAPWAPAGLNRAQPTDGFLMHSELKIMLSR